MERKRIAEITRAVAGSLAGGMLALALGIACFAFFEKGTPIDAYADTVVTLMLGALALMVVLAAAGD